MAFVNDFFADVYCSQRSHHGQRICGDVFITKKVKEENRLIAVLSDGMGHGVKANILATLTATMAMNFTREHRDMVAIAETIMNALPECSDRKMSYSTFTIVDIELNGQVHILEYDNPTCQIIRGNKIIEPEWNCLILRSQKHQGKELHTCSFWPQKEDRIVFCSDGIAQSGMGRPEYPFGWGVDGLKELVVRFIDEKPTISSHSLSMKILNRAMQNDHHVPKDDTSCGVIYLREPRRLLLCSGPPFKKKDDNLLAQKYAQFQGPKILSGATTADIIARELKKEIVDSFVFHDPDLPPMSSMDGADLVTEGILTLEKVNKMLKTYNSKTILGKGPADSIIRYMLKSDEIYFLVGTGINIAHQDPNLPIDLEIRRTVINRIARTLESDFLKEIKIEYI